MIDNYDSFTYNLVQYTSENSGKTYWSSGTTKFR